MKIKELVPYEEENIFNKIKNFFRKILKKKKEKNLESEVEKIVENIVPKKNEKINNNEFEERIKIDTKLIELNNLKNKLDKEIITIDDLSDEQVSDLLEIYKKENLEMLSKINKLKNKINS